MSKIRIYELAKKLNMTNKELLEKIKEMDISVTSHMSSLDEDFVARIKAFLGGDKPAKMEEKRIKSTVIRRRKKVIKKPVIEKDKADENKISAETKEKDIVETKDAKSPGPDEIKLDKIKPAKIKPKKTAEPAATIIKPAKTKEKKKAVEPAAPKPDDQKPTKTKPDDLKIDDSKIAETKKAEIKTAISEKIDDSKPIKALKKSKPITKAHKTRRETPAKIIKLAKPLVQKAKKTLAAVKHKRPRTPFSKEPKKTDKKDALSKEKYDKIEPSTPVKKKKVNRARPGEPGQDKAFFNKKISFRKREVVEGNALYSKKRKTRKGKKGAKTKSFGKVQKTQITTAKAIKRRIKIEDVIVLADLAKRMGIKANEMIAKLMGLGVMVTVNQTIDFDTALLVAAEFDYELEKASTVEELIVKTQDEDSSNLMERPPVVTIMGHVDHGKTSLLDVIRKTRVTESEAGGITQHIGAYQVKTKKGDIVFLDTPGHEAFSAMRSRGAKITDIVILVVAADDGVMPQTIEAVNHSKASGVPIIVAVNKIDKDNADPDRVLRELSEIGLTSEEWGGDTIIVKVSAKKNQGINQLLEMILLQTEMLELKANPDKLAVGRVVEAKLDFGRGPLATVLIEEGTLKVGDPVVCGIHYGKIRALLNDSGKQVTKAGPSMPVEIIGLSGVPAAGDELVAVDDEKNAKQVSAHRSQKFRAQELAKTSRLSLEGLFERMQEGEVQDLNIIIKADVDGSIEALKDSLVKLSNNEVEINVVHSATGTITDSVISLAAVSTAIIIGFNVRPNINVQELAKEENIDIRFHNIIYNVIDEMKGAIVGMMKSTYEERVLGRAEVRQVFHVPKIGTIAGSYVMDGKIVRNNRLRLLRDGVVVYDGKNNSLRRFKDDVKEVQSGYECGIGIENFNDIKVGDELECYCLDEIKPELK